MIGILGDMREKAPVELLSSELARALQGPVVQDEMLAPHTSFNVGGLADIWIEPQDLGDLCEAIILLRRHGWPVMIIGNGTNLLVSDAGIRGAVLCLRRNFRAVNVVGEMVQAGAGVSMPLLATQVSRLGLSGYEWACGVPGSIGGSVVMNAGAHGGDTSGCAERIHVVAPDGSESWLAASELGFRYRHSDVPEKGLVVTGVEFRFHTDDPSRIRERLEEYRQKRRAAQPETSQCAGSIFKNPPGGSAGRLLEGLGARGMRVGGAEVSEKHANFIVNAGGARASDVRRLIRELQQLAGDRAGIRLEPEVLVVGEWGEEWRTG